MKDIKFSLPELHGTPEQQLRQLKNWIYQLVEKLNLLTEKIN